MFYEAYKMNRKNLRHYDILYYSYHKQWISLSRTLGAQSFDPGSSLKRKTLTINKALVQKVVQFYAS